MAMDDDPRFEVTDRGDWRGWLEANHEAETGVWAVTFRKGSGEAVVGYDDLVEEALCFGWVDSVGRGLDERQTMLRFSPRKPGSGWSRPNKQRVERLERDGLMAPAGATVIAAAKEDGSWTMLDDVENLVIPPDLAEAFARHPGSAEQWEEFPRSPKRAILEWIVQAKRPETRAKRIEEAASKAARGERANEWKPKEEKTK